MNIFQLRKQGRTQGFGPLSHDNSARLDKWLRLVNVPFEEKSSLIKQRHKQVCSEESSFVGQIKKDTARAFHSIDFYQERPEQMQAQQQALDRVLLDVFNRELRWDYYQGFHDIGSLFLTLFQENDAYVLTYKAGQLFFHDGLKYSFDKSVLVQLSLVIQLIKRVDPEYYLRLQDIAEPPVFAISWLLTWFVHTINDVKTIVRLFDYLLSSPPQTIIYLCATFILNSKAPFCTFLQQGNADPGFQHQFFQKMFENVPFQVQHIITQCEIMQFQHPLHCLSPVLPNESNMKLENYLSQLKLANKLSNKERLFYEGRLTSAQKSKRRMRLAMQVGQAGVLALALHSQHKCPFFSALLMFSFFLGLKRLVRSKEVNRYGQHKVCRTSLSRVNYSWVALVLGLLLFRIQ